MKRAALGIAGGVLLLLGAVWSGPSLRRWCADAGPRTPSPRPVERRCPVCGMFVDRHAAWLAEVRYADGEVVCFDGVKDLFRYYFDVSRFHPQRTTNEIRAVAVTDYYSVCAVDGYAARYVMGSDVLGPMGHELIPFATEPAARDFLRDHHGTRVLTFPEVTPDLVASLERPPARQPLEKRRDHRGAEL